MVLFRYNPTNVNTTQLTANDTLPSVRTAHPIHSTPNNTRLYTTGPVGIILWQLLVWCPQPYDHIPSNLDVAAAVLGGQRPRLVSLFGSLPPSSACTHGTVSLSGSLLILPTRHPSQALRRCQRRPMARSYGWRRTAGRKKCQGGPALRKCCYG